MNVQNRGIPLRPDPAAVYDDAMRSLCRAALAVGVQARDRNAGVSAETVLQQRNWDADRLSKVLTRAAVSPAMTTQSGWAAELAQLSLAFLVTLAPYSAAAALLEQSLRLSFGERAHLSLPTITPGVATFVAEGAPFPVKKMPTAAGVMLERFKLASIVELTREMVESSDAEAIMRTALIDSAAPGLDNVLFSNSAAVAGLHPAGILVGATSVTPSTATYKADAMVDDIAGMIQAIAPYVGNGSVAICAAPAQATRIALAAERTTFTVFMSNSLAAGTAVAVALNALVSAVEPVELDTARSVVVVEDDVAPGAPLSSQTRSVFQTDSIAVRLKWPLSWIVRDPRAVAVVSGAKW
jgi:Phage capsid family